MKIVQKAVKNWKAAKADYQDAANWFNREDYRGALKSVNRTIKGYHAARMIPWSAMALKLRIKNELAHENMAKNRQKYILSKLKEDHFHM